MVFAGSTYTGVLCTTSISLPVDITLKTLTINSITLNNYGVIDKGLFVTVKQKYGFYVYSTDASIISGCINKILTINYSVT